MGSDPAAPSCPTGKSHLGKTPHVYGGPGIPSPRPDPSTDLQWPIQLTLVVAVPLDGHLGDSPVQVDPSLLLTRCR